MIIKHLVINALRKRNMKFGRIFKYKTQTVNICVIPIPLRVLSVFL